MGAAKRGKQVSPKMPWYDYNRHRIPTYFEKMWSHRKRILTRMDPEAVHKMRVAARRLRVVMLDIKKYYPKADFRKWNREVDTLARVLGAVRDFDIMIQFFTTYRASLPPSQQAEIQALIGHSRARRRRQHQQLRRRLRQLARRKFAVRFLEFFSK